MPAKKSHSKECTMRIMTMEGLKHLFWKRPISATAGIESGRPKDVPIVAKTKFPANVHVLGVVSSEGDVMPTNFFSEDEIITK
ncbi:hypothetical protein J437_LFUL014933 [Ladona fulva]|uniref:Uncharacterized protein n=1 Tax=Ladona fulva TaxID=123851 RepID=A0A8K0P479_LADFU|nr:hypothetical protein J437_LFUL014933 [Ladona fulva]